MIRTTLGFIVGVTLLYVFIPNDNPVQFEELALGDATEPVYTLVDKKKIHCNDMMDSRECIAAYEEFGREQSVTLWLGNSQVHAINQPKSNDETAATELHRKFQLHDKYFVTYSQPNANLQEHYILFANSITNLPVNTLVLPVVFDDMREDGIRTSISSALKDPILVQQLSQGELGLKLYKNYLSQSRPGNDLAGLNDTVQERVELVLNEKLIEAWSVWASRPSFRGEFLNFLYLSRNWIFGINPSTTRKIIPGRYALNLQAFSEILDLAAYNRINVLAYIVPLRNDVKHPYQPEHYEAFKSEVERITFQKGFYFSNFENIVPSEFWGFKSSTTLGGGLELDFMHFTADGHRLLAESIYERLLELSSEQ
ncbi:hypothetical protein N8Z80_02415 [Litorivicinus sp.]|nr:hypothetical protein [Litorivicinus sp.]